MKYNPTNIRKTMKLTDKLHIADIIVASTVRELSDDEKNSLNVWLESAPVNRTLYMQIRSGEHPTFSELIDEGFCVRKDFEYTLNEAMAATERSRKRLRIMICAAALIPVIFLSGIMLWRTPSQPPISYDSARNTPSAILIRGDGSRVELISENLFQKIDDTPAVNEQRGAKTSYKDNIGESGTIMNTIIVQAGNNFRLELSDGTRVFMDAASELRYPVRFDGEERRVQVSGRVYFEVSPDIKPFVVETPGSSITVYGTEFCVDDSGNGSVTTLVSGHVKVSSGESSWELSSGQQVSISDGVGVVYEVDTTYFTAWKDGYFMYEATPLVTIIKELSLWYGIDFLFERDGTKDTEITARIKKYDDPQPVLDMLGEANDLEFIRKNDRIVIRDL